ncbi:MAG: TonB-dependent receptor [Pseudomonadota bacterium]
MNLLNMKYRELFLSSILLAGISLDVHAQESADNAPAPSSTAQPEASSTDAIPDDFLDSLIQESADQNVPAPEVETPTASVDVTPEASAPAPAEQESAEQLDIIPVQTKSEKPKLAVDESRRPQQIEEIVVTATKREESLREIPATIAVLSGKDLERQGVQSIDDIVTQVPGVNLTDEGTGGTAKRITIRGVSAGLNVNPTAGTLFGDIPFSDPFAPKVSLDPNPFDMATVEVLKGPQGTLFGGTGLNGLIRYVPQAPQLDEFRLKYYVQQQSYPGNGGSGLNYGGMVNAPFAGNKSAMRLVAFRRSSPGYTDNTRADGKPDVNTLEQYGLRAALRWEPTEQWKIGLMATTQSTRYDDLSYADNYDGNLQHGDSPRASPAKSSYSLGSLNIEREFDWGSVISQTSYFEKKYETFLEASRAIGGLAPILAGADDNHSEGITQELRLVSAPSDSPWKWLAGAFFYKLNLYDCASVSALQGLPALPVLDPLQGLLPSPCPGNVKEIGDQLVVGQVIADITVKENALFGEVTRSLGDYWDVTLGARGYRIQSGGTVSPQGAVFASGNQGMNVTRKAEISQRGISPKASIVFHPTDEVRGYLTASRGFRFGGPQIGSASTATTTIPAVYKSDSLWNYELGLRTDWFDRTLTFDASMYYIVWKDPQVNQIDSGRTVGFIDNVGGAKGKGMEMSLRYLAPFVPGLSLDTSVALNKLVTTELFNSAAGVAVPAGSPWPLSPRWQTSTTLAYTLPIDVMQAGASIRHSYMGKACNQIECDAMVFGYQTWDLNVFASGPEDSFWPQVSVSLNNLTDKRGYGNITVNPDPAKDSINYIAPRSLVLRLSGSF